MPEKPMVENISWILSATDSLGGLLLGNVYGAQDPAVLKEYGVRAVLTLALESLPTYSPIDIPMHLHFAAHDKEDYVVTQHIAECIAFIEESRAYTNVYVHCYAGVSRSAAIICGYLMWKYDWSLEKTMAFVVFKRIVAKPNDGFMRQLKEYQEELQSQKGVNGKNRLKGTFVVMDRGSNASNPFHQSIGTATSLIPNIPRAPSKANTSILNYDPSKSLKQPLNFTLRTNQDQNKMYAGMPVEKRNTLIYTQKEEPRETMEGNQESNYNGEDMRQSRMNTRSLNQVKNEQFLSPRDEMNPRNARGSNQFWDPKVNVPLATYYRQAQNSIRTTSAFESLYKISEHAQKGRAEANNAKSTLTYKHSDTPIPKLITTKVTLAQQQKKSRNMLTSSNGFQTGSPSTKLATTANNLYNSANSSSVPDLNPIASMYMSNQRSKIPRISGKEDSKFKRYEQQKMTSLKTYESIETSKKDRNSSRVNLMPKDLPGYKK